MKVQAFLKANVLALLCKIIIMNFSYAQDSPGTYLEIIQLTHNAGGHTINNTQCFSHDDQWIVYDTRNNDSMIGSTGSISMVNTLTGGIKELYHTQNQTSSGPGVGAATFSPMINRVIFIHGIRNADKNNPYSFTRRTGVAVDIANPFHPIFMDARDIIPPFTPGALRGGTHAHNWSADGQWISFTYNDYILEKRGKTDPSLKDLRTVGVMIPGHAVKVNIDSAGENNNGEMFAVLVALVTETPQPGSDEISRAFDEGWIGNNGYQKSDGSWQHRALAFQGAIKNSDGTNKNEVFVLDLPDDLTKAITGLPLEGTISSRPNVPAGIIQRRVTFSSNGIVGPRHWLRCTPDGKLIAFLSKDDHGIIQVFGVSPNKRDIKQLTFNSHSVQGPFNFSPDGKRVAYLSANSVFITEISTGKSKQVTPAYPEEEKPWGSVVWSNNGKMLAFNKFVADGTTKNYFLQVFLLKKGSTW
ncbi:MAG: DUF3748 domain-containing protein [Ginsengibacter sp.]